MKSRMLFSVLLLSLLAFAAIPTVQAAPKRMIKVSAQAELEVDPDVVDLRFTLKVETKTPKKSVQGIAVKEKLVLAVLQKAGMKISDVQISFLSLYPRHEYRKRVFGKRSFGLKRRVLRGYEASKVYVACIRDISKMAHFVEALAGANVSSFSAAFRSTNIPTHKKKLRAMAVKAGIAKAGALAKLAGVALGAVQSVVELQPGSSRVLSQSFGYTRRSGSRGARPGAIKLRLSVRMSFAIK